MIANNWTAGAFLDKTVPKRLDDRFDAKTDRSGRVGGKLKIGIQLSRVEGRVRDDNVVASEGC